MADDQAYLDALKARRAQFAGIKQTTFSDQSTTFDPDGLDKEIARLERLLSGVSRTRYAATSKGV
jgi:hypothetical protein